MYNTTAKGLAALGRNGDSTLMHVNPEEIAALSQILGPTTTNPNTGLPEAYSWSNMLGSIAGGLGSFGAGALLEPIVGDALGGIGEGLFKDILKKAIPATVGAGIGAAVGGATGGKSGALGGAAQGFMSGGLGAWGSEDVLGAGTDGMVKTQPDANLMTDKSLGYGDMGSTTPTVTPAPTDQGFFDKIGSNFDKAYSNLSNKDNLKDLASDYAPYLFQAGLIGQGMTDNYNAQDQAKKQMEQYQQMQMLRGLHARQQANQLYAGIPQYYADGGPVSFSAQGPVPVRVTIPSNQVEEAGRAGGIEGLMASRDTYSNGGYINTQQINPDDFYPQSQIHKAQPYPAATPIRHEVVNAFAEGGYIDGEGDGMSDDIDADIDNEENVRVADGEFVIPKHIAERIGVPALDKLLREVRRASYGTDEQIDQNAGKLAAQRILEQYS